MASSLNTTLSMVIEKRRNEEEDVASGTFNHIFVKPMAGNYMERLRCMSLDHQGISSLDAVELLASTCPNLNDLDLSHNLLDSWSEVFSLLHALPLLRQLNVSFNPLSNLSDEAAAADIGQPPRRHPGVKTLILNGTLCSWTRVHSFLVQCPSVEELHLSCNEYTEIDLPMAAHGKLKRLHFNNNSVTSWKKLERVGSAFPELRMLVARGNPLTLPHVKEGGDEGSEGSSVSAEDRPLASLSNIILSETKISSVDELRSLSQHCPELRELRLQNVPLVNEWPEDMRRNGVIVCLPQLTHLNGSKIDAEEMEKAERAFVRHFGHTQEVVGDAKEIAESLMAKHGSLLPLAEVNLGPPKGNIMLRVHWDAEAHPEKSSEVHTIKVPLTATFIAFRNKLAKRLNADPRFAAHLEIFHQDEEFPAGVLQKVATPSYRALYDSELVDGEELHVRLFHHQQWRKQACK